MTLHHVIALGLRLAVPTRRLAGGVVSTTPWRTTPWRTGSNARRFTLCCPARHSVFVADSYNADYAWVPLVRDGMLVSNAPKIYSTRTTHDPCVHDTCTAWCASRRRLAQRRPSEPEPIIQIGGRCVSSLRFSRGVLQYVFVHLPAWQMVGLVLGRARPQRSSGVERLAARVCGLLQQRRRQHEWERIEHFPF